ncbi:MAG: MotA/TolQ/ExbB proton channel family protein [Pseudomonadota bacterium]
MNGLNPVAYFFAHTDPLGMALFWMLILMSVASWFWIFSKAWRLWRLDRLGRRYRRAVWAGPGQLPSAVEAGPFARLAEASFAVHASVGGAEAADREELLLRCMNRVVGEEAARLDNGQTLLASVAGIAPFVGLFGTVWGVHHALSAIGIEGAASLEQIAGPVGEALIMTALGLAVAIPALLGYNVFSRSNQMLLARLDGFAHELHHFLVTGQVLPASVRGE